jgi:cupin fold WbuC family metalloprotein
MSFLNAMGLSADDWSEAEGARSPTAFARGPVTVLDEAVIDRLDAFAATHETNCRLCLHPDPSSPIQEMLIAQHSSRLFPPKAHALSSKSFEVLRGTLAVVVFEPDGRVRARHVLEVGAKSRLRLEPGVFHVDLPVGPHAVHQEIQLSRSADCAALTEQDRLIEPSWKPDLANAEAVTAYRASLLQGLV